MKIIHLILICIFTVSLQAQNAKDLLNKANNVVKGGGKKNLSNEQVVQGLKEALTIGSNNASASASKMDGFLGNAAIKIPFPPEAREVESKARQLGMSAQVNEFVKTLNRAAEEASKEAAPIFVNAVKGMTFTDGVSILRGNDDAATQFLNQRTSPELKTKFRPVIKRAIDKVQLTKYWSPIITRYNKLPMVRKMNPNLEDYVLDRTLKGLFTLIAQEEFKIRKDPAARVNDILRSVFGG
jgi:hypothetical protein